MKEITMKNLLVLLAIVAFSQSALSVTPEFNNTSVACGETQDDDKDDKESIV